MEKSKKEKKQTIHPEQLEQVTGGNSNTEQSGQGMSLNIGSLNTKIKNRLKDNGQITS